MYFVFADDSKRDKPIRQRMGPLVAAGAILVYADRLQHLETSIEALCQKKGFPVDDPLTSEFKWSPGRELWMWSNLTVTDRERFFLSVIEQLREAEVKVIVAIDDKHHSVANSSKDGSRQLTHEQDATYLLFEKINWLLRDLHENAIIINDRPSGPSRAENDFLAAGLEMWRKGTRYVQFDRIAINLLCTQSRFVRLLQCADVVTSCVTAYVSGEHVWSPRVFAAIKPLLYSKDGRIGGYGSGLMFKLLFNLNK
jgi:hypothetical protein